MDIGNISHPAVGRPPRDRRDSLPNISKGPTPDVPFAHSVAKTEKILISSTSASALRLHPLRRVGLAGINLDALDEFQKFIIYKIRANRQKAWLNL